MEIKLGAENDEQSEGLVKVLEEGKRMEDLRHVSAIASSVPPKKLLRDKKKNFLWKFSLNFKDSENKELRFRFNISAAS